MSHSPADLGILLEQRRTIDILSAAVVTLLEKRGEAYVRVTLDQVRDVHDDYIVETQDVSSIDHQGVLQVGAKRRPTRCSFCQQELPKPKGKR